jgi:cellulose synthase/poly-beta-1,6-N-acetylglucosamine synthase-like glycosyltransferase
MYFNTVAITFSLALTVFLAAYIGRSLIFFFIARNIMKAFPYKTSQARLGVTIGGSFWDNANAFLNSFGIGITETNTGLGIQSELGSCTALNRQFKNTDYEPFISVLIATYNELKVIDCLMKSCAALTYNQNKFEVIVIDDSEDETFRILKIWEKKIQNLKVIHRSNRKGWKGGAMNVALNNMSAKSSYALIVDADNILPSDTLERFVSCFNDCNLEENIGAIQGYPISRLYYNDNNSRPHIFDQAEYYFNWVSKANDFRLAKRNLVEFVAKDRLSLPIQITGSLFMIKSELIKSLGFSEDLTEDWNLTLDLYFSPDTVLQYTHPSNCKNRQQSRNVVMRKVLYDPSLISYSSTITKFRAYFRQRMRVSEGHTRGFRKNVSNILTSKIRLRDKVEFFLMGLQYSKFIAVVTLIIIDFTLLASNGIDFVTSGNLVKISLLFQAIILLMAIGISLIQLDVCSTIRSYNVRDALYLIFLSSCTIPAFVIGSFNGFFRNKGIFYRTERNID